MASHGVTEAFRSRVKLSEQGDTPNQGVRPTCQSIKEEPYLLGAVTRFINWDILAKELETRGLRNRVWVRFTTRPVLAVTSSCCPVRRAPIQLSVSRMGKQKPHNAYRESASVQFSAMCKCPQGRGLKEAMTPQPCLRQGGKSRKP